MDGKRLHNLISQLNPLLNQIQQLHEQACPICYVKKVLK
jgi:hypothetical protein